MSLKIITTVEQFIHLYNLLLINFNKVILFYFNQIKEFNISIKL